MLTTIQVYIEALVAFALMSTSSIIAGFIAAAVTGDRTFSIAAALDHLHDERRCSRCPSVAHGKQDRMIAEETLG